MIIDKFENLPLYFSCLPGLDRAAEFLSGGDIADGRHEIDGEKIFANVSSYEPKEFSADMRFEAHKKYADLQAVLAGGERIDWAPLGSLKEESEEYSKGGDIAFYSGEKHMSVTLSAGEFVILFPGDAHKPCIRSSGSVKKAVIKLALE